MGDAFMKPRLHYDKILSALVRRPARREWLCFGAAIAFLLCIEFGMWSYEQVWLRHTESALKRGELDLGTRFPKMSSKAGSLRFSGEIDGEAFKSFLGSEADQETKSLIVALLGWSHRSDLLDSLKALTNQPGRLRNAALLSLVAIEKDIPFTHKSFSEEYFESYAVVALNFAKSNKTTLREAAETIGKQIVERAKKRSTREGGSAN